MLDEVDRMLDIGFRDDIKRVMRQCPAQRQTVFVSATISPEIEALSRQYMRDPEKIVVASGSLTVAQVRQFYLTVPPWAKRRLLLHLLTHEEPALTLVFCRLKRTVDDLTRYLHRHNVDAHAIHADLGQGKRNAVMERLRSGSLAVLVASDLASRGIDVEGITHVVNYDLPDDIEVYVHRIGRTARAGRDGVAWSLVTAEQGDLLTEIEKLINLEIPKLEYPDFDPGPPPEGFHTPAPSVALAGPGAPAAPPAEDRRSRFAAASEPKTPEERGEAIDLRKFPGGIVPAKAPPKRMYGRVPSPRSDWK
jgi:ATP-dependent RNA helicase DeaD